MLTFSASLKWSLSYQPLLTLKSQTKSRKKTEEEEQLPMGVSVKIMRSTVFDRNGEPPYKFKRQLDAGQVPNRRHVIPDKAAESINITVISLG